MKLLLNLSREEQRVRFLKRIDVPERNWKFSAADARERRRWDDYQVAFSQMLSATSTEHAPWYVVPADHKWFARICAAAVLVHTLIEIDPQYPAVSKQARRDWRTSSGNSRRRHPKELRGTPTPRRTTGTTTGAGARGRSRRRPAGSPVSAADRSTTVQTEPRRRRPRPPTAAGTRGRPPTSRRPLGVDPDVGLSAATAAERLRANGPNALPEEQPKPGWLRFVEEYRSYMQIILVAAAVVSLVIAEWGTAVLLLVLTVLNAVIGLRQEGKAESAMNALRSMLKATARVRRDGDAAEIPAEELVVGDVVLLSAGDQVPADGRIVAASSLQIDESALTGESVPASKDARSLEGSGLGPGDQTDMAFMNTPVTHGSGTMVVTGTGARPSSARSRRCSRPSPRRRRRSPQSSTGSPSGSPARRDSR